MILVSMAHFPDTLRLSPDRGPPQPPLRMRSIVPSPYSLQDMYTTCVYILTYTSDPSFLNTPRPPLSNEAGWPSAAAPTTLPIYSIHDPRLSCSTGRGFDGQSSVLQSLIWRGGNELIGLWWADLWVRSCASSLGRGERRWEGSCLLSLLAWSK